MTDFQIHGIKMLVEKGNKSILSVGLSAFVLYTIMGFAFGDHNPLKFLLFVLQVVLFYLVIHGVCWGIKVAASKAYSHLWKQEETDGVN